MKTARCKKKRNLALTIIFWILVILIIASALLLAHVLSIKKDLQSQFGEGNIETEAVKSEKEEIEIYLPEVYYAVTGFTTEIYNNQVTSQCADITKYNILWSCDIGENLERKYSLTATEEMIGEHELTFCIYDNALNLLTEKTCTLKVIDGNSKRELKIYEIRTAEDFSVEEIQAEVIEIFLEADNVQDGKKNAEMITGMIEEIKSAGIETPIYVINAVYQSEPNPDAFYLMSDLSETLDGYENVYFVPVAIGLDSEYNYEASGAVKPNEAGYHQIADMIFAVFCGTIH